MSNLAKPQSSIVEAVKNIAQPIAESLRLNLWDVKFVKEGSKWYLKIFIDKKGGVDIQDCENMSKKLDEPLEILDCIKHSYCLEVSSPGIERELSNDNHLSQYIGSNLTLKFFRPNENGKRSLTGKLISFNKEKIILNYQGKMIETLRKNISRINLKVLKENY